MPLKVQKKLSPNDTGGTRGHQAGIHVPKPLTHFFPALNETTLNPRAIVHLQNEWGGTGVCTYIHYNNKVVSDGTRDEYRITRIRPFLSECGARTGDTIEFNRLADNEYKVRVIRSETKPATPDTVVVDLASGWKTIRV